MSGELRIKEALNLSGYTEREIATVARNLALTLRSVVQVVRKYEDWFVDCPEDSWRLQRDLMKALDILPEPEDIWEQDDDGEFIVDSEPKPTVPRGWCEVHKEVEVDPCSPVPPPEAFMPADLDDEREMRL